MGSNPIGGTKMANELRKHRLKLIEVWGRHCMYCKSLIRDIDLTLDHLLPLCRGGGDNIENLALACKWCNSDKGPLTYEEFMSVRHDKKALKHLKDEIFVELNTRVIDKLAPCRALQ